MESQSRGCAQGFDTEGLVLLSCDFTRKVETIICWGVTDRYQKLNKFNAEFYDHHHRPKMAPYETLHKNIAHDVITSCITDKL